MSVHLMSKDELRIVTGLRSTEFLHGLDTTHLKKLAAIASEVEFPEGEIIHRAGDVGEAIYLIQEGQVNIDVDAPDGSRVTVLTIGAGQIFGLSSLFPPQRKKGTARVVKPTRAIVINSPKLLDLFEGNHELQAVIMGRTAKIINERVKSTWLELAKNFASRQ
jgi:CRP/FNR family cyclic AMP-dependent transcriptional regulator